MKIVALILIVFLLFSAVMISGCISTGEIQSQDDVSSAVNDISTNVEDIETILNDIDEDIG